MSITKDYSETSQLAYFPIVEPEWMEEKKFLWSQTDFFSRKWFPKSYNTSKISQQAVKLPFLYLLYIKKGPTASGTLFPQN